jgi:hypothetical protein
MAEGRNDESKRKEMRTRHILTSRKTWRIELSDTVIPRTKQVKYVGLRLDSQLADGKIAKYKNQNLINVSVNEQIAKVGIGNKSAIY